MEQSETETTADGSLFDRFPPPSCITKPSLHGKETEPETQTNGQNHLQRKNTDHRVAPHIHTCMCAQHTRIHTHSLYEQSSCAQWSWERQHCLVQRHHLHNLCHCPAGKTHLHRGDCLYNLFICWVTWGYFTSTHALKYTTVYITYLASFLRRFKL